MQCYFCCEPSRWRGLLLARALVVALSVVASSGDKYDDGLHHHSLRRRNLLPSHRLLDWGNYLRGPSLLEPPPVRILPVGMRELHSKSKSSKSKSSKSKYFKSKSSKNSSIKSASSSTSSKGAKSYTTTTSKSGKSKSSKKGKSESKSKSAKEAARSEHSSFDMQGKGKDYFHHNTNSSNDDLESPSEYETIIPATQYYSAEESTGSVLDDDNTELLLGNLVDESASSNNMIPNSEYTTIHMIEGSDSGPADLPIASSSSSSNPSDATTEEISENYEPTQYFEGDFTDEIRIAEGEESEFIDGSGIIDKDGANDELVEKEAILDFSNESLE